MHQVLRCVGVRVADKRLEHAHSSRGAHVDSGEELDEVLCQTRDIVRWCPDTQLALKEGESALAVGHHVARRQGASIACPLVRSDVSSIKVI